MSRRIIVIGGGLAGLAAAAGLASAGVSATLLEARPRLGGRAGSFLDARTGEWIDTCQHVSMGCCTNLNHFAGLVEIQDLFAAQQELLFVGPDGQRCSFRDRARPAPFHLTKAFASLTWLSSPQRRLLMRDVARLAHRRWNVDTGLSFEQWLQQYGTTAHLRQHFWDVVLVSALSESAEHISVPHARKVFADGFLANRKAWQIQIPTAPLDELYGLRLIDWLTTRGIKIRTGTGLTRLTELEGLITHAHLRSGEVIAADEFVLAVPWHRVLNLLPDTFADHPAFAGIAELTPAAITSVHLWFDREVLDVPHAALVGRLSQWVFRRATPASATTADHTSSLPGESTELSSGRENLSEYVQVVISASHDVARRSHVAIVNEVIAELSAIWPTVKSAQLESSRVITEHRAVFSPCPGVDASRPSQTTPADNLHLAGDWTATGWPATMESAVKSGFIAAENVLLRLGKYRRLVQPPLRPSLLSRLLLRM